MASGGGGAVEVDATGWEGGAAVARVRGGRARILIGTPAVGGLGESRTRSGELERRMVRGLGVTAARSPGSKVLEERISEGWRATGAALILLSWWGRGEATRESVGESRTWWSRGSELVAPGRDWRG